MLPCILVIDDDESIRELYMQWLRHQYHVMTAESGASGIKVAQTFHVDLVVCDVAMRGMNGFDVLREMQKIEAMADVPFIFLSGSYDYQLIREGMNAGADDFLIKPVVRNELLHVLQTRLHLRDRRHMLARKAIEELSLNVTTALPHELRTSIMIMEGYARLMHDDVNGDPMQSQMVQAICDNAVRLRNMAEKYLWYLKTYLPNDEENGEPSSSPHEVIPYVAGEVAQRFNRTADLQISVEAGATQIGGQHLSKVIEEIVENAFKFSKSGTPVRIEGYVSPEGYLIEVSDMGIGITPDQIVRIGGFMQFDRSLYEQKGTGLGLIIAKRLVEINHGYLTVHSKAGETMVSLLLQHVETPSDPATPLEHDAAWVQSHVN